MIETLERLPLNTPTRPVAHILANYFQKFISYWTQTDLRYLGELQEEIVDMPVELCVRWNGNAKGMLVIRCYEDFLTWLKKSKGYRPLNICTGKDLFNELVSEYCTFLIHNFWKSELLKIGPILPQPCGPQNWPSQAPDAAFGVLAEGNPVEIRLWLDPID